MSLMLEMKLFTQGALPESLHLSMVGLGEQGRYRKWVRGQTGIFLEKTIHTLGQRFRHRLPRPECKEVTR